jgi:F-type H+-transporting ATPase subunit c
MKLRNVLPLMALFVGLFVIAGPTLAQDAEVALVPANTAALDAAVLDDDAADRLTAIEGAPYNAFGTLGKGLGLGLVIFGAAKGIGAIGSHAVDAIARQPEASGAIGQNGLILAALIEGATLFAIVAFAFFL